MSPAARKKAARPAAKAKPKAAARKVARKAPAASKAAARPAPAAAKPAGGAGHAHCAASDPFGDPCQNLPRRPSKHCVIHSYLDR